MSTPEELQDRPREGESLHEWMARRQAEMFEEATKEPLAYVAELAAWNEAHPDSTFAERDAAFEQIKQKYPKMVEFERKSNAWDEWKADNADADFYAKDEGYQEIWGVEADESDYAEDPEFWEYDPETRTVGPFGISFDD